MAYKLSRKKNEENYKVLHTVLFRRRGKAAQVKSNISQFSGFVWHDNEDKEKNKIKENLDKCVKEKSLEFCDLLYLPISRATTKKEDIVTKLFEFLEAPQATTSALLADEELPSKGNKRNRSSKKSTSTSGSAPSKSSAKSWKRNASEGEEKKDKPESDNDQEQDEDVHGEQENVNVSSDGSEGVKPERAKSEEKYTDYGAESEEETKTRKRVSTKKSSVKKNPPEKATPKNVTTVKNSSLSSKISSSRSSFSHPKVQDSDVSPKTLTRKKKTEAVKEKSPTPKKSVSEDIAVLKRKEKKPKVEKLKPSDAELRNATCEILREVDFNTATFTDVLKLLVKRFNTDLVPRKSPIKLIIQDELIKLIEEEDEEVEALKDDKQASVPGLEV